MEDIKTSAVLAYEQGYQQGVRDSAINILSEGFWEKLKDIHFDLVVDSHVDLSVVQQTKGCTIHLKLALTYGDE